MNFSSATKVQNLLTSCETVEFERQSNRDRIAKGINGFPPLNPEAAKKMGLKINISWLEETVLAKQAALQYFNAFQSRNNYFVVDVPSMPVEKRTDWSLMLTQFINRPLKKSREYSALKDEEFASLVAHGISPKIWLSTEKWLADFIALADFRVPTDTATSLKNLCWFAVRRRYTIGELVERVFGKYADEGWDKEAITAIIAAYWNDNWDASSVANDWYTNVERMTSLVKQNMGYYQSDAVPVITLWHFYHLNNNELLSKEWMMNVVPDKVTKGVDKNSETFLFTSDEPVAENLDQLIHIQFGDLNGTPPYMYHSVRSLGFLLHESCFWMNLFRCRTFQHAWESFNLLYKSADGGPKARAQFLEFFHKGYVPNEVTILGKDQKNTVDQAMIELVMGQAKQLMGEASASFVQDIDTGTEKEQTLGEAQIKLQQSNAMMTGLLAVAARNTVFEYREICRRFCIKKSLDPDVRKFRKDCIAAGIPVAFLNADLWDITCDMPLGSGNATLELAAASQLMQVRAAHSPDAQQEILHMFDAAVTKNASLAQRLAPVGAPAPVSTGTSWAVAAFGTLMQGIPVPMQPNLNSIDQINTLLGLLAGVVHKVETQDNVGTPDDLAGFGTTIQYIQALITQLAQDPAQKAVVKQSEDDLAQLTNIVKGFAQRQAQANKAKTSKLSESLTMKFTDLDAYPEAQAAILMQNGLPATKVPEADPKVAKAQVSMAINVDKHHQKMEQSAEAFQQEQAQEAARTHAEIASKGLLTGVDAASKAAETKAEVKAEKSAENPPAK